MSRSTKKQGKAEMASATPNGETEKSASAATEFDSGTSPAKKSRQEKSSLSARKAKKQEKKEAKAAKKGEHGKITPSNAKKYVGVAKIVGPAIAPFAVKAFGAARESYDRFRARQLGVPVDELGRFSGKGAALHARIAGDAKALQDLRQRSSGQRDEESSAAQQFADSAEKRLGEFTSAVRASERMPAPRRRAAYRAVEGELSRIEDDLLRRFGVSGR